MLETIAAEKGQCRGVQDADGVFWCAEGFCTRHRLHYGAAHIRLVTPPRERYSRGMQLELPFPQPTSRPRRKGA